MHLSKQQAKPKREHPQLKSGLHPRNRHRERYNFAELTASCPELSPYVRVNDYGDESVDFFNPEAVKMLNKALLMHFYGVGYWDIPQGYLCPPIPGRADYIHHAADLLAQVAGHVPRGNGVRCLDVGVGANCIYPIVGRSEYGWSFVGSDIDRASIASAQRIVDANPLLRGNVEIRLQGNADEVFNGIIGDNERFDLTLCNPPFHKSLAEAQQGAVRKLSNLKGRRETKPVLNFGGKSNELWCKGGEEHFVRQIIRQSKSFNLSCLWFTTLVSKQTTLALCQNALKEVNAKSVRIVQMSQGNKQSRILAWTYLSDSQQKEWASSRWG